MIKRLERFSRFFLVGIFNTLFDFSILNALVFGFGMQKISANIVSTSLSMSISYLLNHRFVFREDGKKNVRQFVLFIIITAFGLYVLQSATIYFLAHSWTWPAHTIHAFLNWLVDGVFSKEFVELNFAKIIATLITMIWNYELYKRLVFIKSKGEVS